MIEFSAKTDPGNRPGENQDSIGSDAEHGLWLVADGMGGHADGAIASRIAKETLLAHAAESRLATAVLAAHDAVRQAAGTAVGQERMGSTMVCARLAGTQCELAWVGDSRAYLWRRSKLRRMTRDHTYVEVLRQAGTLSEDELRSHPNANVVIQTLGIGDPVPSELDFDIYDRDWLLLCSDGLTGELSDTQIAETLRKSDNPGQAVDLLIDSAIQHGGGDNVSVVVVQAEGPRLGWLGGWLKGLDARAVAILAAVGGVLMAAVVALAILWFFR